MRRTLAALSLTVTLATVAHGQQTPDEPAISSNYSRITGCPVFQIQGEPVWETACATHNGWSVFIRSTEHGSSLSYAHDGSERSVFTRPPMMRLYGGFNDTIEFRVDETGPFATIHRYVSEGPTASPDVPGDAETGRHDLLMVTALNAGANPVSCVVAYVDALMISEANEAARLVADHQARTASCEDSEPLLYTAMDDIRAALGLADLDDLTEATETP